MKLKLLWLSSGLLMCAMNASAQDPCASITTLTCGTAATFSQNGPGNISYPNNIDCNGGSAQGGLEQIYQFTAPADGTYEIEVSSATGGNVQYLYKNANLTCNNTGWNCISRNNDPGSIGSVNLTANETYYFLLNAEGTATASQTFTIDCVRTVCADILTLSCDTDTTFGPVSGYGDEEFANDLNCNIVSGQGGKEQIYQFTAPANGTYELEVLSTTGGLVQFLYKNAGTACDENGWLCIERTNETGSIGSINLVQGQTYYLLLNSEVLGEVTRTFKLKCARVVCDDILPITCGENTTFGPVLGYGDEEFPNDMECNIVSGQGGKEQIYQFTAPTTATYEIEVISATSGMVQFLYKNIVTGCDNDDWFCIRRNNGTGSVGSINLEQGETYYLLLNAETTGSTTVVFRLKCARVVCNDIIDAVYNETIVFGPISGYGDADFSNDMECNIVSGQGGKEQIYQLNACASPMTIDVTAVSGGNVQYLWKPISEGCGPTGWTCLGRIDETGMLAGTIPANTPAYLLLNAELPSSAAHNFTLGCTELASEKFNFDTVDIYPNPTTGNLHIVNLEAINGASYKIFNTIGQIVLSGTVKEGQSIFLNGVDGVYYLKISDGERTATRKIILKR